LNGQYECKSDALRNYYEESEEMYSGVSSVPKISSGRRSRLKKTKRG
jgi:hypothetical protein